MEMDSKCMQMETDIKDSLLMGYHKGMENINGLMGLITRVISSKEVEMDMEFGKILKIQGKYIKAILCLIKSMDMEFMIGEMATSIKAILWMILDMEKENFSSMAKFNTMDIGKMVKKLIINQNLLI